MIGISMTLVVTSNHLIIIDNCESYHTFFAVSYTKGLKFP